MIRWFDVVWYAAAAAAIWAFAGGVIRNACSPLVRLLEGIPFWQLVASLVVLAATILRHAGHGRWRGFLGVEHFWAYPPLWLAVMLGWLFIAFLDGSVAPLLPGCAVALGVICGPARTLIRVLWHKLGFNEPKKRTSLASLGAPAPVTTSDLIKWVSDDAEIDTPALDWFGHDVVAQRIARRLSSKQTDEVPTIALIGPVGSGKSSIRALVQWHLESEPRLCIVDVSLWPFESTEAATAGILTRLLRELSQYVNTAAISGFSDRYLAAVERLGGPWQAIGGLLRRDADPERILEQFSNIAQAIGLRVVLWIEDIERFSGEAPRSDGQPERAGSERLAPIRALLYLLDRCPSISVVLATTTPRFRVDLSKIARFLESPPPVEVGALWQVIGEFRASWLARPIIDPADPTTRHHMEPDKSLLDLSTPAWRYRPNEPRIHEALSLLLRTPRALKDALRVTHDAWKVLAGEIDLDDVLVISAIRTACPSVFAYVAENIEFFRRGFESSLDDRKGTRHPKYEDFVTLLKEKEGVERQNAVLVLLRFVFPMPSERMQHNIDDFHRAKPQGLSVKSHVDYWHRYLTTSEIDPKESDQEALTAIRSWRDGEPNSLVDRLTDGQRSPQIETFERLFDSEDLIRLLEEVVNELRSADLEYGWLGPDPGFLPVWRMMNRQSVAPAALRNSLLRLIKELIPVNLPLVQELVHYMAEPSANVRSFLGEEEIDEVRTAVHEQLQEQFPSGAERKLLDAIGRGSPFTVSWLCWGWDRIRARMTDGVPFEGWSAFSEVLLEAAVLDPSIGLVQVLPFVTATKDDMQDRNSGDGLHRAIRVLTATFDEQKARELFNLEHLLEIVRDASVDLEYLVSKGGKGRRDTSVRDEIAARLDAAVAFSKQDSGLDPPEAK